MSIYDVLKEVNSKVNESTVYKSDMQLYNKPDFWEIAEGSGDCEEYVLAKRSLLIDKGINKDIIHLALCYTETDEYRAVLIVEDWVLDNCFPFPMRKSDLNYRWDKIQVGLSWFELS